MAIKIPELKEGETDLREYFGALAARDNTPGVWRRAANALLRNGIASMESLCELSESDLLRIRNFGRQCLILTLNVRKQFIKNQDKGLFPTAQI